MSIYWRINHLYQREPKNEGSRYMEMKLRLLQSKFDIFHKLAHCHRCSVGIYRHLQCKGLQSSVKCCVFNTWTLTKMQCNLRFFDTDGIIVHFTVGKIVPYNKISLRYSKLGVYLSCVLTANKATFTRMRFPIETVSINLETASNTTLCEPANFAPDRL